MVMRNLTCTKTVTKPDANAQILDQTGVMRAQTGQKEHHGNIAKGYGSKVRASHDQAGYYARGSRNEDHSVAV